MEDHKNVTIHHESQSNTYNNLFLEFQNTFEIKLLRKSSRFIKTNSSLYKINQQSQIKKHDEDKAIY